MRTWIQRLLGGSEVREFVSRLDEIDRSLASPVFPAIRRRIEELVRAAPGEYVKRIRSGRSIDVMLYTMIGNFAADEVESGRHHVYRGALDQAGSLFLQLHGKAVDNLVQLGEFSAGDGESHKAALKRRIADAG